MMRLPDGRHKAAFALGALLLSACGSTSVQVVPTHAPMQGDRDPARAPTEAVTDIMMATMTVGPTREATAAPTEAVADVEVPTATPSPAPDLNATETLPPPPPTPASVSTPTIRQLEELEPIAGAPFGPGSSPAISFPFPYNGWSPDGRYMLYRTHTLEDLEVPQFPPGAFFVYDTHRPDQPCTQVTNHTAPQALHFWLPDNQLVYVTDQGDVVRWPVCSDEQVTITDQFPELPQYLLAANVDHSQFLLNGRTSLWLWNPASSEAHFLTELGGGSVGPDSASFSPNSQHIAISFHRQSYPDVITFIVDAASGEPVQTIQWGSNGGKGGPGVAVWLSDTQFFIDTFNRGPLLGTVHGEVMELAPQILGEAMPPLDYAQGSGLSSSIHADEATGDYHLLLVASNQFVDQPPHWLYHSETDELEELSLGEPSYIPAFSPDGERLALHQPFEGRPTTWIRPVDPPGSEARPVLTADNYLQWSPDWSRVAVISGQTLTIISTLDGAPLEEWKSSGPIRYAYWSPDGRYLQVLAPLNDTERLFLVPVGP